MDFGAALAKSQAAAMIPPVLLHGHSLTLRRAAGSLPTLNLAELTKKSRLGQESRDSNAAGLHWRSGGTISLAKRKAERCELCCRPLPEIKQGLTKAWRAVPDDSG
jgi:hypothetical protein